MATEKHGPDSCRPRLSSSFFHHATHQGTPSSLVDIEPQGFDAMAKPGALPLGELAGAQARAFLGRLTAEAAAQEFEAFVVADGGKRTQCGFESLGDERVGLFDQATCEHRACASFDARVE